MLASVLFLLSFPPIFSDGKKEKKKEEKWALIFFFFLPESLCTYQKETETRGGGRVHPPQAWSCHSSAPFLRPAGTLGTHAHICCVFQASGVEIHITVKHVG